jgi:DUF1680 family protein
VHAAAASAVTRPEFGVSASPFAIGQVRLAPGRWLDNQNRTLAYLRFIDADRMLHTFRTNVGLASSAQPVGGWEGPGVELRGHTMGHLLSALAQAYAITGDLVYKTKGDYLVNVLVVCQAAAPSRGYHTGYLSAFPESFFDRLESGQGVWAPWYTLHKIMAGLLDQDRLVATTPGSYATVTRVWSSGDTVTVRLPMQAVLRANNDAPGIVAVTYGPVVLAGHYGNTALSAPPTLTPSSVTRTSAGALTFTAVANGFTVSLIPLYDAHGINYNLYWNAGAGDIPTGYVRITNNQWTVTSA